MLMRFKLDPRWLLCLAGIAAGGLCLAGCFSYPDSSDRLNDNVVFTGHAKDQDFSSFRTFAIDPIVHVADVAADNKVSTSDADVRLSDDVVNHVSQLMESRGFQRVQATENPDLGVTITGITGEQAGAVTGGYWGGYYSAYWGFPGYSYYYPYTYTYTYQTGSLVIDIADLATGRGLVQAAMGEPDDMGPAGLPVVWGMVAYRAYVPDDQAGRVDAATTAIDQAFEQSPYLTRK